LLQFVDSIATRLPNPVWNFFHKTLNKSISMTEVEKVADRNAAVIRATILGYGKQRASGEAKNDAGDSNDLLSLLLAHPELFTVDDIVDGAVVVLTAATQMTYLTA